MHRTQLNLLVQTQVVGPGVERFQPYEINHLPEIGGLFKMRRRRFYGCGILTNPLGSTSCGCNLLILWRKCWVENLVPNQMKALVEIC